ncbi:MAG: hypothetical protein GY714_01665 [Desulfobacterales bacterium]|nr:hypothetical protein [Desulfobacterales bacterium]
MPVEMERKLRSEARRKGMSGKEADAFVYGTMRKQGWKPSTKKVLAKVKPRMVFSVNESDKDF